MMLTQEVSQDYWSMIGLYRSIGMVSHLGKTKHTSKDAQESRPPRKLGMPMNRFLMVCARRTFASENSPGEYEAHQEGCTGQEAAQKIGNGNEQISDGLQQHSIQHSRPLPMKPYLALQRLLTAGTADVMVHCAPN